MKALGIDKGTYSIRYSSKEVSPPVESAVDWNWNIKGHWARSERDGPGGIWSTISDLDDEAYQVLLSHFGLEPWADEFPKKRVIRMSPKKLCEERRRKEFQAGLKRKEIISDTIGYHGPAEIHF